MRIVALVMLALACASKVFILLLVKNCFIAYRTCTLKVASTAQQSIIQSSKNKETLCMCMKRLRKNKATYCCIVVENPFLSISTNNFIVSSDT